MPPGWFYFYLCSLKFLFQIKFCVSLMIFMGFMNVLTIPLFNGYSRAIVELADFFR